jgi:tRNA threonylcarbamoyladenosine biosynthesis protein TsaE
LIVQRTLRTRSESETEAVARSIARLVPDGTVIGLVGVLGSGKTCFVRGLATGLGIDPREVSSPTFVYLVEYAGGRLPLRHADLYRLGDLSGETAKSAFAGIGLYDALEGEGVTVVEWWDYYVGPVPDPLILVEFVIETVDLRTLTLTFSGAVLEPLARALGAEERG